MERLLLGLGPKPLVPFHHPQPLEAEDSDRVPDLLDADSDTDSDTDSEGVPDLLDWDDGHAEGDDDEIPPLIGEDSMPALGSDDSDDDVSNDEGPPPLVGEDSMPALGSDDSDDDVSDDEGPPPLVGEDSDDDEDLPPLVSIGDGACPEQLKRRFSEAIRGVPGNPLTGPIIYVASVPSEAALQQFAGRLSRSQKGPAEAIGNLGGFAKGANENQVTSCNVPAVLPGANGKVRAYVTYPELFPLRWRADVTDSPGMPQEVAATGGLLEGEKRPVDCTGVGAATTGGPLQGKKCPEGYPGVGATKEAEPQEWSTGLFDCCVDMRTCLLGTFCPSILYGMTSRLVNNGSCVASTTNHLLSLMFGTFLGGCFLCHWGYAPCITAPLRSAIRNKYGLDSPDVFGARNEVERKLADCVMHYWCHACALCQEHREVKHRMEVENEGTYIIPPVIEEMEKPAAMAPAGSIGMKEGAGGVYYTLLAGA